MFDLYFLCASLMSPRPPPKHPPPEQLPAPLMYSYQGRGRPRKHWAHSPVSIGGFFQVIFNGQPGIIYIKFILCLHITVIFWGHADLHLQLFIRIRYHWNNYKTEMQYHMGTIRDIESSYPSISAATIHFYEWAKRTKFL